MRSRTPLQEQRWVCHLVGRAGGVSLGRGASVPLSAIRDGHRARCRVRSCPSSSAQKRSGWDGSTATRPAKARTRSCRADEQESIAVRDSAPRALRSLAVGLRPASPCPSDPGADAANAHHRSLSESCGAAAPKRARGGPISEAVSSAAASSLERTEISTRSSEQFEDSRWQGCSRVEAGCSCPGLSTHDSAGYIWNECCECPDRRRAC